MGCKSRTQYENTPIIIEIGNNINRQYADFTLVLIIVEQQTDFLVVLIICSNVGPDSSKAIKIFEKCCGVKIFVFNLYNYVYSCVSGFILTT